MNTIKCSEQMRKDKSVLVADIFSEKIHPEAITEVSSSLPFIESVKENKTDELSTETPLLADLKGNSEKLSAIDIFKDGLIYTEVLVKTLKLTYKITDKFHENPEFGLHFMADDAANLSSHTPFSKLKRGKIKRKKVRNKSADQSKHYYSEVLCSVDKDALFELSEEELLVGNWKTISSGGKEHKRSKKKGSNIINQSVDNVLGKSNQKIPHIVEKRKKVSKRQRKLTEPEETRKYKTAACKKSEWKKSKFSKKNSANICNYPCVVSISDMQQKDNDCGYRCKPTVYYNHSRQTRKIASPKKGEGDAVPPAPCTSRKQPGQSSGADACGKLDSYSKLCMLTQAPLVVQSAAEQKIKMHNSRVKKITKFQKKGSGPKPAHAKDKAPAYNAKTLPENAKRGGDQDFKKISEKNCRKQKWKSGYCELTANKSNNFQPFEPYLPMETVLKGLKRKLLIQGALRINPRNFEDAYIPHQAGHSDIYISGLHNRNRALNGDIVAVLLDDRSMWRVSTEESELYGADKSDWVGQCHSESDKEDLGPDVIIENEEDFTPFNSEPTEMNDSTILPVNTTTLCLTNSKKASDNGNSCHISQTLQSSDSLSFSSDGMPATLASTADASMNSPAKITFVQRETKEVISPLSKTGYSQSPNKMVNTEVQGQEVKKKVNKNKEQIKKKFLTLEDLISNGHPLAKRLFDGNNVEDTLEQNDFIYRHLQQTGKVVAIIEKKHPRVCTGYLKYHSRKKMVLFSPLDTRLPRVIVSQSEKFENCSDDYAQTLFVVNITEWKETNPFAEGILAKTLGEAGQIETETEGILIENDVDFSEFSQEVLNTYPIQQPWHIPQNEITSRRDFRKQCVFTIDPSTARDLDDALSIDKKSDGVFEVGVHIADVSFFVKEKTALDKTASCRATSVYLVQKVIPMLPRLLCEELCSLNPGQDRLTLSVVWEMTERGEILHEWFGRSVIKSCAKLSYDHAQSIIENSNQSWSGDELPHIFENFTAQDIKERILHLHEISKHLRKQRFNNGALRLDQVKLQWKLDPETGLPQGFSVYEHTDSNRLIEELMLLANMAVAQKIYKSFQGKALLRQHSSPRTKMAENLKEMCATLGLNLDVSSAGAIQQSLTSYCGEDDFSKARLQILVSLCSKPMKLAKYFCTGSISDENYYHHFALNVPLYTHFTSPIRRYPDIVVHRMLAASLGYCPLTELGVELLEKLADYCNDKKTAAKRVQELSSDLFFAVFLKKTGPFHEEAMVMNVLDHSFDVFILKFGVSKRVYCNKLPIEEKRFTKVNKIPILTLIWKSKDATQKGLIQKIQIFTLVQCILHSGDEPLKWTVTVKQPAQQ